MFSFPFQFFKYYISDDINYINHKFLVSKKDDLYITLKEHIFLKVAKAATTLTKAKSFPWVNVCLSFL